MQAVQSGMQAYQAFSSDGENATSRAVYNEAYATASRRLNFQRQKSASEKNIAAVRQDLVLSNMTIQMRQREAKAFAKVQAAVSGVEGGSYESVLYQTEANEAFAASVASRQAEQGIDQLLANISTAQAGMLSSVIEEPKRDTTSALLNAFSELSSQDLNMMREGVSSWWGGNSTEPNYMDGTGESVATIS